MEVFIAKIVGEVSESVSVCGVKSVKEVLDLYKGMSDITEGEPPIIRHPEVVLEDGSVAVSGMTLGEGDSEADYSNSNLLGGGVVRLTEFELFPYHGYFKDLKRSHKNSLGDDTHCLRVNLNPDNIFDLTIGDIKLLHREFGAIIKFWEE